MQPRNSGRVGFTLAEMLLVVAIIATLAGLLMPAIQAARESARRVTCANNLKQLGVALETYHDTHSGFPSAYLRRNPEDRLPSWSWSTFILPRLEEGDIFDALDVATSPFGHGGLSARPSRLTQSRLASFICPADLGPDLNHRKDDHAKSNYRAVYGEDVRISIDFEWVTNLSGMFFVNSRVRKKDVTDGSSNTFAVGECVLDATYKGKLGALWAGMHGWHDETTVNSSDSMWGINGDYQWKINGSGDQAFGSRHPTGANFLFADSSVQFIRDTVNGPVLNRLAARNDGQL